VIQATAKFKHILSIINLYTTKKYNAQHMSLHMFDRAFNISHIWLGKYIPQWQCNFFFKKEVQPVDCIQTVAMWLNMFWRMSKLV
jgi:hypothetical protein